jgi:nucleoside 2-deoxyribosyltransferase
MPKNLCIVCNAPNTNIGTGGSDGYQYDCPNCGRFILSGTAKSMLGSRKTNPGFAARLSYEIRRMQRSINWPQIHSNTIKYVEDEAALPNVAEQADNLILILGKTSVGAEFIESYENLQARVGAETPGGVRFIVEALTEKGLLRSSVSGGEIHMRLSFSGWQRHNELTKKSVSSTKAFMAMAFGNEDLQQAFINHFKPAVKAAGFDLIRLDENPKAGSIDERLRVELRRSAFVVADLTDKNLGAYWEAGFAEGLGKPVIYTCERSVFKDGGTHFDTNHLHTVLWSKETVIDAAEELKATVRATLPALAQLEDPE